MKPTDTDRYGRVVAIVYTVDGKVLNELLLINGLAWHYKRYDKNPAWTKLELQAKQSKVGVWYNVDAIAP